LSRPPFRADHVGSLLRPERLRQARRARDPNLRAIEDECIREVVALQEGLGLQAVTDGEFRRGVYHNDFLARLDGVSFGGEAHRVSYQGERKKLSFDVPKPVVSGKLRWRSSLAVEEITYLRGITPRTAKVCIPAPSTLHFGCTVTAYTDAEEFHADLVQAYRDELAALYDAGCRYVQIDDPHLGFLCDPARSDDAAALSTLYAELIERSVRGRPADLAVCVHVCRGNFSSTGAARGGYEPVAEAVFGAMGADGFFLEFDDERSGGFEPLRFVPKGTRVVLGLVSTKRPTLEPEDALRRRIDEAAKVVPLEDLCISPQCGFSTTEHGTDLTEEEQAAKLRLVVRIAERTWQNGPT
jgi:5-methyltetrahydropteroyltriglutamate--homocysteine methyltransferase